MDDAFGGDSSYATAKALIDYVTAAGESHETRVNVTKTRGPAKTMVILGLQYSSDFKICSLDPTKVTKYSEQISSLLRQGRVSSKDLERILGRLEFAA